MQNAEPNIYGSLGTIRNGYMQMQWNRVQMFLVFNTVALPVMFNRSTDVYVKAVLGVIGTFVSVCIPIAVWRGQMWLKFFNEKMAKLEELDMGNDKELRILIFSDSKFKKIAHGRLASRKMFVPVALLLSTMWFEETYHYLYTALIESGSINFITH